MPLDPNIYRAIEQPQQVNPLAQLAQVAGIQGAQQQNRLAQLQMQEYERARQAEKAKRGVYAGFGTDTAQNQQSLFRAGLGQEALSYGKSAADLATTQQKADAEAFKNKREKLQAYTDILGSAKDQASYDLARQQVQSLGVDTSTAPAVFNPGYIAGLRGQALTEQQRIDAEDKQRNYALKANNELIGPDGKPNQAVIDSKKSISKAGASNVNVKVDAKLGEGLASQVGPMMKESAGAAEGAARQIDAANRIVGAVDSNKLFAGPGAETRLTVAQISDTLGIGGNTNAEKIANTRQALQGLSQLTLQGRQQMRGQGAITESESKLAERATSGDISMTPAEIKQLANAAKRAANYMQSEHQRKLGVMRQNSSLSGMVPFYDVAPVPEERTSGGVIDFGSLK